MFRHPWGREAGKAGTFCFLRRSKRIGSRRWRRAPGLAVALCCAALVVWGVQQAPLDQELPRQGWAPCLGVCWLGGMALGMRMQKKNRPPERAGAGLEPGVGDRS